MYIEGNVEKPPPNTYSVPRSWTRMTIRPYQTLT